MVISSCSAASYVFVYVTWPEKGVIVVIFNKIPARVRSSNTRASNEALFLSYW